ncbi:hypothetical protein M885DRAFT_506256 [Pelagophyceae sp. CCMP2097]|nr:hypothetical protein M885DRAFT_506256 [Pelagophyceae sp. CCMP2097]|mmetsp:Transcript_9478/g.32725  ORF Transcript_9478/g.32725 Transcript_9478/m.32725 type:complete len:302 (-) Transcript_9478:80-985(-)
MKFGHDLVKVIGVSDPEWAPFFIQYKLLKKYIKRIRRDENAQGPSSALCDDDSEGRAEHRVQLEAMTKSAPEVSFFKTLRVELKKSSHFFKSAQQVLEIRRERISEALKQLRAASVVPEGTKATLVEDADGKALSACVTYYRDLLLLENYAIINYCGFSKILKKHDKQTGFKTRTQFMRVCVAPQPFTHYPRLLEMIKEAEELYAEIRSLTTQRACDGDDRCDAVTDGEITAVRERFLGSRRENIRTDETDFIDAILNLRSEAVRIREAEDDTADDQLDEEPATHAACERGTKRLKAAAVC